LNGGRRGQSVLYVVVLLPVLLLILALSIEVGTIQITNVRLRSAVDLATVSGASVVDPLFYGQTGRLRLDRNGAAVVAREFLARNLLAIDPDRRVATSAEITIVNDVPARDPYTGTLLDRPAVCIHARLPVRAGLLRLVGTSAWVTLTASASAELRA
jgi:hypothetical protein